MHTSVDVAVVEPPSRSQSLRAVEARLLHPHGSKGLVIAAGNVLQPDGSFDWVETAVPVEEIETHPAIRGAQYVTPGRFFPRRGSSRAGRSLGLLEELGSITFDVDFHSKGAKRWKHVSPMVMATMILTRIEESGLPRPSYIMCSGRGLYVRWLTTPITSKALPRWQAMVRWILGEVRAPKRGRPVRSDEAVILARRAAVWQGLGVDRPATSNAAGVFRPMGAKNRKAVTMPDGSKLHEERDVRLLWPASFDQIARYDFDDLATEILPLSREELREKEKERKVARETRTTPVTKLTRQSYWRVMLDDLTKLLEHRGGMPEGCRQMFAFYVACGYAWLGYADRKTWATELAADVGLPAKELRSKLISVERRMKAAQAGKTQRVRGPQGEERRIDPRYKVRAATIVETLGITAREAVDADLRLLAPGAVKAGRAAERMAVHRRAKGMACRDDQQSVRLDVGRRALALQAEGRSLAEVVAKVHSETGRGRTYVTKAMAEARLVGRIVPGSTLALPSGDETKTPSPRFVTVYGGYPAGTCGHAREGKDETSRKKAHASRPAPSLAPEPISARIPAPSVTTRPDAHPGRSYELIMTAAHDRRDMVVDQGCTLALVEPVRRT